MYETAELRMIINVHGTYYWVLWRVLDRPLDHVTRKPGQYVRYHAVKTRPQQLSVIRK